MSAHEVKSNFEQIVEFSEMASFLDTPVKRYSAGMQLRLWFSVVSHLRPEVLLVDETLSVGDAAFQKQCTCRIRELVREGSTVVLVSHDLSLIRELSSRVLFLVGGKAEYVGGSEEALRAYEEWLQG